MRLTSRKIGLVGVAVCLAACLDCGRVNILPFPKAAAWTQRTVNNGAGQFPVVVAVADFDGDNRLDILAGYQGQGTTPPAVVILFQTDVDNFEVVQIASSTDLAGVAALVVSDLDGDGNSDVVAACNGRLILLHGPADPRQGGDWTLSIIDQSTGDNINQWNDVAVGDIDDQSGQDIVACNADVGRLSWFQSPGAPTSGSGWTRIDIDATTRTSAASVALEDIDGDGKVDVYSTAPGETTDRVAWYRNPADPASDAWTKTAIGNDLTGASRIAIADLSGDSRSDLIVVDPTGLRVGWYIKPTDPTTTWPGYVLTVYTVNTPVDVQAADIDGNGQIDVVVATENPGSFRWFTPIGSSTLQWGESNLGDLAENIGRFALGDIDADGRSDVIAPLLGATADQDKVGWFENPEP